MTTFLFANNAQTTLAASISNVAVTATLASGSGVLFPTPGANQQFALTFTDAATGLLNEIVYVTNRSGDVITMVRGQEGTSAIAWSAGDNAAALVTAGTLTSLAQTSGVRTRLTADTTFYVATTGSDTLGDGSNGNPWATCQHAVNVVQAGYDLAGFNLTILRKDSTAYTDAVVVTGLFVGQSTPVIFDASSASNVTVTVSGANAIYTADQGSDITVRNQRLVNSTANGVYATHNSTLTANGITFGAINGSAVACDRGGQVNAGPYTIAGAEGGHISCASGGNVDLTGLITFTGTPAITTFASVQTGGTLTAGTATFTGTFIGTKYTVVLNGVISVNGGGANFFPGTINGSTATGGQYA